MNVCVCKCVRMRGLMCVCLCVCAYVLERVCMCVNECVCVWYVYACVLDLVCVCAYVLDCACVCVGWKLSAASVKSKLGVVVVSVQYWFVAMNLVASERPNVQGERTIERSTLYNINIVFYICFHMSNIINVLLVLDRLFKKGVVFVYESRSVEERN